MLENEKVKHAQALKELRENLPAILDGLAVSAQYTRMKFLELCKQGFTEAQALELCKS